MIMKNVILKTVLLALIFIATGTALKGQEKGTSEFGLGYGVITSNDIINVFSDALVYSGSLGNISVENEKSSGAFYAEYNYAVAKGWILGADLVYERFTKDIMVNNTLSGSEKDNVLTIAFKTNYSYLNKPNFRLYSGVGIGYSNVSKKIEDNNEVKPEDENNGNFNFHVTGLGVRFGEKLAIKSEIGFGYKGLLSAGLSYQF